MINLDLDAIMPAKLPKTKGEGLPPDTASGAGISVEELNDLSDVKDEPDDAQTILDDSANLLSDIENEMGDAGGSETNIEGEENDVNDTSERRSVSSVLEEKVKLYRNFISGRLFLKMIDGVLPQVVVKGGQMARLIKKDADWTNIQLTDEQLEELEPLADEIVDYIFTHLHPIAQFGLSMGASYVGNFHKLNMPK